MNYLDSKEKEITRTGLLENLAFGFFRIDSNDKLVYANNSLIKLLEFENFYELQTNYQSNVLLQSCFSYKRLSKIVTNQNEFTWITKHNTKKIFKEFVQTLKHYDEVIFVDCLVQDVTDQIFLEKLIKDINSNEASILKAIPDFILVVSKNFEILESKNNISKLFPDFLSVRGLKINEIFEENISNELEKLILYTINTGDQTNLEFEYSFLLDKKFFEARIIQRNSEEAIIIIRDISREKIAEDQLKSFTEELKQINATKDKFFSIIAHDLRTPLNGILNYAEILSNEYNELSKEEIKEFADYILEISRSTNNLLNNLLEWSRIQSGKISFEPEKNNLFKVADKVLNMLKLVATNKGININNNLDRNLEFVFDKNMLASIFLNLVNNAIKFSNKGNKIEIMSNEFDNYYKISVKDEGIGMSDEVSSKLFNSNNTISTLGTAKEKGTGLGLILCKEFVKRHKGNIWVESKLGKGSTFSFTISKDLQG